MQVAVSFRMVSNGSVESNFGLFLRSSSILCRKQYFGVWNMDAHRAGVLENRHSKLQEFEIKILFELFLTGSFGFDPLISKFIMICIINRCISLKCAL